MTSVLTKILRKRVSRIIKKEDALLWHLPLPFSGYQVRSTTLSKPSFVKVCAVYQPVSTTKQSGSAFNKLMASHMDTTTNKAAITDKKHAIVKKNLRFLELNVLCVVRMVGCSAACSLMLSHKRLIRLVHAKKQLTIANHLTTHSIGESYFEQCHSSFC